MSVEVRTNMQKINDDEYLYVRTYVLKKDDIVAILEVQGSKTDDTVIRLGTSIVDGVMQDVMDEAAKEVESIEGMPELKEDLTEEQQLLVESIVYKKMEEYLESIKSEQVLEIVQNIISWISMYFSEDEYVRNKFKKMFVDKKTKIDKELVN